MPDENKRAWRPPAELAAKMPHRISGDAVNGLGETAPRRPTPIMWHHPRRIPDFAAIQEVVNETYRHHPQLGGVFDTPERREPHAPVASERVADSPENWTQRVKAFALGNEADLVGIARMDPDWVFEGFEVHEPFVIVLGVAMDHAELSKAPEVDAAAEVAKQ